MKKLILLAFVAVMAVGCSGNRTKVPVKYVITHSENKCDTIITTHYEWFCGTLHTKEGDIFNDVKTVKRIE